MSSFLPKHLKLVLASARVMPTHQRAWPWVLGGTFQLVYSIWTSKSFLSSPPVSVCGHCYFSVSFKQLKSFSKWNMLLCSSSEINIVDELKEGHSMCYVALPSVFFSFCGDSVLTQNGKIFWKMLFFLFKEITGQNTIHCLKLHPVKD